MPLSLALRLQITSCLFILTCGCLQNLHGEDEAAVPTVSIRVYAPGQSATPLFTLNRESLHPDLELRSLTGEALVAFDVQQGTIRLLPDRLDDFGSNRLQTLEIVRPLKTSEDPASAAFAEYLGQFGTPDDQSPPEKQETVLRLQLEFLPATAVWSTGTKAEFTDVFPAAGHLSLPLSWMLAHQLESEQLRFELVAPDQQPLVEIDPFSGLISLSPEFSARGTEKLHVLVTDSSGRQRQLLVRCPLVLAPNSPVQSPPAIAGHELPVEADPSADPAVALAGEPHQAADTSETELQNQEPAEASLAVAPSAPQPAAPFNQPLPETADDSSGDDFWWQLLASWGAFCLIAWILTLLTSRWTNTQTRSHRRQRLQQREAETPASETALNTVPARAEAEDSVHDAPESVAIELALPRELSDSELRELLYAHLPLEREAELSGLMVAEHAPDEDGGSEEIESDWPPLTQSGCQSNFESTCGREAMAFVLPPAAVASAPARHESLRERDCDTNPALETYVDAALQSNEQMLREIDAAMAELEHDLQHLESGRTIEAVPPAEDVREESVIEEWLRRVAPGYSDPLLSASEMPALNSATGPDEVELQPFVLPKRRARGVHRQQLRQELESFRELARSAAEVRIMEEEQEEHRKSWNLTGLLAAANVLLGLTLQTLGLFGKIPGYLGWPFLTVALGLLTRQAVVWYRSHKRLSERCGITETET